MRASRTLDVPAAQPSGAHAAACLPSGTLAGLHNPAGSALLAVMFVLLIVTVLGLSTALSSSTEVEISANYRGSKRAFYGADGASHSAFDDLVNLARSLGRPPTDLEAAAIVGPAFHSLSIPQLTVTRSGPPVQQSLTSGFYQGLLSTTTPYTVAATARTAEFPTAESTVRLSGDLNVIPLFQFAVFYDQILEILPGPPMLLTGRVHSNSDVYLKSGNSLTIDSVVTSVGDIYNRRLDSGSMPGGVELIRDGLGNFPAMNGLDSTSPTWHDDALARWNGNVLSQDHGVVPVNLTIPTPDDPRKLIELGLASDSGAEQISKLYYETSLRIVNGVGYDSVGNVVSLIDPLSGNSAIRASVILDPRENREMLTFEVDVDALGRTPGYPADGTVYLVSAEPGDGIPFWPSVPLPWQPYGMPYSGNDTEFAFKLSNGDTLPGPLTVISDNPVYIRGDYNTTAKQPAAVMADTIHILSNNWGRKDAANNPVPPGAPDDDLGYSQLGFNDRIPANTSIHTALLLGTSSSVPGQYQGGLENIFRMLEEWTGVTLTYRGSFISLWNPLHTSGDWSYGSPVYTAPNRNWGFDTDLLDLALLPPLTPNIYSVTFTDWNIE